MKRAEEKLRKSEEKLRLLTTQLLTAQEDERKRLAAELHDELGHALLTLKLHLSGVEQHLLPEQADLKEKMREIVAILNGYRGGGAPPVLRSEPRRPGRSGPDHGPAQHGGGFPGTL